MQNSQQSGWANFFGHLIIFVLSFWCCCEKILGIFYRRRFFLRILKILTTNHNILSSLEIIAKLSIGTRPKIMTMANNISQEAIAEGVENSRSGISEIFLRFQNTD